MRRVRKSFLYAAAALMAMTAVKAAAPDVATSPYQGIVERNVFGLKPPPNPEDNLPAPEPPPKLLLTGITTILGNKRALLTTQAAPNKPAESLMLTEGQRDGEIEVLQIDENAGTVKVNNHGVTQTLDFKTDGVKLQTAAAPAPVPGAVPPPIASQPGNPTSPLQHQIPTRVMRTAPGTPGVAPNNPLPTPPPPAPRTALPNDVRR